MFLGERVEGDCGDDVLLEADELQDGARDEEVRLALAVAALHVEVGHHAAEPGAVRRVQKVVARLGISALKEVRIGKNISEILPCIVTIFEGGEFV